MKKFPVIALVAVGLLFAGLAEAAPKKRTRNQNRIGPYGEALVGQTNYTGDQSGAEDYVRGIFENGNIPFQNLEVSSDDTDVGYQLAFGYRFHRYLAGEISLAQFGQVSSKASAGADFGSGFVPASVELAFNAQGPVFSVVGILPVGEHLEAYARLGYMFASVEREYTERIDGQTGVRVSAKGDSQEPLYGVGLAWNVNQVYSIRVEYQKLDNIGQSDRTGTEDLTTMNIGLLMRF